MARTPNAMRTRVLFLFTHLHKGGMQRAASNISRALPDDVLQYIAFFDTAQPGFLYNATIHDFHIPSSSRCRLFGRVLTSFRRIKALRSFINAHAIDTVVSFGESANLYNLATPHRARTVISIRVDIASQLQNLGLLSFAFRVLMRLLYPRADCVVPVSYDLAMSFSRSFPSLRARIVVINNMYHIAQIQQLALQALPPQYEFLETKRLIVSVGALIYQKGHDLLLEAFAQMRAPKDFHVVIVGSGEMRERLISQAHRLQITQSVTFVEFDHNPYRYMSRATLFVLPSRFEGFPNVLVEAMICGAPVVAFDCPTGPREILGDDEFGVLVHDLNAVSLSRAMTRLVTIESFRVKMQEAARSRGAQFGTEHLVERWMAVLRHSRAGSS